MSGPLIPPRPLVSYPYRQVSIPNLRLLRQHRRLLRQFKHQLIARISMEFSKPLINDPMLYDIPRDILNIIGCYYYNTVFKFIIKPKISWPNDKLHLGTRCMYCFRSCRKIQQVVASHCRMCYGMKKWQEYPKCLTCKAQRVKLCIWCQQRSITGCETLGLKINRLPQTSWVRPPGSLRQNQFQLVTHPFTFNLPDYLSNVPLIPIAYKDKLLIAYRIVKDNRFVNYLVTVDIDGQQVVNTLETTFGTLGKFTVIKDLIYHIQYEHEHVEVFNATGQLIKTLHTGLRCWCCLTQDTLYVWSTSTWQITSYDLDGNQQQVITPSPTIMNGSIYCVGADIMLYSFMGEIARYSASTQTWTQQSRKVGTLVFNMVIKDNCVVRVCGNRQVDILDSNMQRLNCIELPGLKEIKSFDSVTVDDHGRMYMYDKTRHSVVCYV